MKPAFCEKKPYRNYGLAISFAIFETFFVVPLSHVQHNKMAISLQPNKQSLSIRLSLTIHHP